jgi:hypothetical protein
VPPRRAAQKLILFIGMAGFLIGALGIPRAFSGSGVVFGFGYRVVICVHLLLFTQSDVLKGVGRSPCGRHGFGLRRARVIAARRSAMSNVT